MAWLIRFGRVMGRDERKAWFLVILIGAAVAVAGSVWAVLL